MRPRIVSGRPEPNRRGAGDGAQMPRSGRGQVRHSSGAGLVGILGKTRAPGGDVAGRPVIFAVSAAGDGGDADTVLRVAGLVGADHDRAFLAVADGLDAP